ncbi:MAG: ABC transporter substrate-binding protein [Thermoprotei archaeon]
MFMKQGGKLSVKSKGALSLAAASALICLLAISASAQSGVSPLIPNFNTPVLAPNQARYHYPYVNKVVYEWTYSTDEAVYEAMLAGQGDIYSFTEPSIIQNAETNPNFNVTVVPTFGFRQIQFNFARYPYNNTYFRRAIISLIDYSTIQSTICDGGLVCTASPMFLLPSSYPAFASTQAYQYYLKYEAYNLTRAMQYLEEAGLVYNQVKGQWYLPNGTLFQPSFLYWSGHPGSQAFAELLQSAAAKINLTINLVGESISTIIAATSVPYNQQTWDMLYLGWVYVSDIGPIQLEFLFGEEGYQSENAGGFYNQTVFNILQEAVDTSNYTKSVELTKLAQVYLMQQLPYIILSWNVADTVANIHNFVNYIVSPGFGVSTTYVHPVGSALNGTLYLPGLSNSAPNHMNIYSSTSAAALGLLYTLYDSPFTTNNSNPGQILPWIAQNWVIKPHVNASTPDGQIVNGQIITLNFARNVTFQDGVPLTAADYNFTLWYLDTPGLSKGVYNLDGLQINYSVVAQNSAPFYFGSLPTLVYSSVNASNPYQISLYFNTSSVWTIYQIGIIILPMHIFDKIPPQELANKLYINELGSGAYIFDGWNKQSGIAETVANYAYWKIDPLAQWTNLTQGQTYTLSVNVTTMVWNNQSDLFNYYPITNATGQIQVVRLSGQPVSYNDGSPAVASMTSSGSVYTGTINTANLAPGTYEAVVNATYTIGGLKHEFLRFYSFTVNPAPTTASTSTTTPTTSPTTTKPHRPLPHQRRHQQPQLARA